MEVPILKHEVNSHNRARYISVNNALMKALIFLGNRYPDPREYAVLHPNSQRLIEIWEKYLLFEGNPRVSAVVSAMMRIAINKIEHSPNYRDRASFLVEELRDGEWKTRSYNHPEHDWNEPKPYGRR